MHGKPILMVEFVARVRALLLRDPLVLSRRQRRFLMDGDLMADLVRREVRLNDEPVALTPIEFRILACLVRHEGKMLPQERLESLVWGPNHVGSANTVRQHIHHLRRKLEPDPSHRQRIVTRWGEGYLFQRRAAGERATPATAGRLG